MTPREPEPAPQWIHCPSCRQPSYGKKLRRNLGVCPLCGHHGRLSARERIALLTDPDTFEEIPVSPVVHDPLGFVDSQPYPQRVAAARRTTGEDEAVVCGVAAIAGHALAERLPTLLVTASGGARMQEGALSLLQMAKVSQAIAQLHEANLLTITLVTDPTYGGVAASYATQSDVIVAEPGARLGIAGPRVIRQPLGADLPP